MKKIVVAMYDEEGYTRRLADYFCQHQKNLFDVRLFTSEESLRKFLIGQGAVDYRRAGLGTVSRDQPWYSPLNIAVRWTMCQRRQWTGRVV